ncbi:MAG: ATP-binding protein [Candidatus Hydrogenedentes bacterium]|nr:ATP-binding protein [Candidatus Hydrogenedentota bacterium]
MGPWYKIVTPREDLREDRPLDASEFAVQLDAVRDNRGPDVYRVPQEFFRRTFLTKNLLELASETVRRLSGELTETNAVFNMATQFGGGKTHALTLLYHLATHGHASHNWPGVQQILSQAKVGGVPECRTGVFVGTEFDALRGRGGDDGTPLRKTPWGELAYQLGGADGFGIVMEHDAQGVAPGGDVIKKFIPIDRPCLILMDELMNFISRGRKQGMATQLYNFLHNLSETVRGLEKVVLVVSIPASLLEMSQEDEEDFKRYKKVLDRLGKPIMMSADAEAAEIIRRRLFEWDEDAVGQNGKVNLNRQALETCKTYADWVVDHRQQVPGWFPVDQALDAFKACYPFHPMTLSVFERKWQTLPRFQRTRGVLRMLALWVSKAYQEGYKGAHRDALIGLGTAPLEDPMFRSVLFEQLDEERLEAAITTDICGRADSHAVRLDQEAVNGIKKNRLHRKAATVILFESNGGTTGDEATMPEVRLALGEPDLDTGNTDTVLEALGTHCYYLTVQTNKYRFSFTPNLNKMLADRRASIDARKIDEAVLAEVQRVFSANDASVLTAGIERRFFPERSSDVPNRPILTLAILGPDKSLADKAATLRELDTMTKECGASSRTFKSGIVWCVPDNVSALENEARKLLAWQEIKEDESSRLDENQVRQLEENLKKSKRDLQEAVWRAYRYIVLLGKDNALRVGDLGLVNSSMAQSMTGLVLQQLKKDDEVASTITPNFLVRNWPPAFVEWSTKSIRDAFFASPMFPKLLNGEQSVKDTIARGVQGGILAYVGKKGDGSYAPFYYCEELGLVDVEISEDMFVVTKEVAERYKKSLSSPPPKEAPAPKPGYEEAAPEPAVQVSAGKPDPYVPGAQVDLPKVPEIKTGVSMVRWKGQVPPQKWMNFYTKVLSQYAASKGLKISLDVEVGPDGGLTKHQMDEFKTALRELGLPDDVETSN